MCADKNSKFDVEAKAFLEANPDITSVELVFPDMNAVPRGKWLPASAIGKLAAGSVRLPRSTYALDVWGVDVEETGLAIATGDPDGLCYPVQGSLTRMPWSKQPMAQVLMTMREPDRTTPCPYDPRHVLKTMLDRFTAKGLTPVAATELEFYLIDADTTPAGHPRPPHRPGPGGRLEGPQVYDLEVTQDFSNFLHDITDACRVQKLPADTTIAEFGPGQFEINLLHVSDVLTAADQAFLFRRLVKAVARRHGFVATFMAKPYADQPGNGLHVHTSLLDRQGNNVFSGTTDALAKPLRHAIAGLLKSMPDAQAVFAPHANSYRRFQPDSFAPVSPVWGMDHRAVAVRVPSQTGPDARLEHRVAGADANPYLVLTAILGGILHGLEAQADPGDPLTGDSKLDKTPPLTGNWNAAIDTFAGSPFITDVFGRDYQDVYAACRRFECGQFASTITDFEYQTYLHRL